MLNSIKAFFGLKKDASEFDLNRSVYTYWVGPMFDLVGLCLRLMQYHSANGNGYNLHIINEKNIHEYIETPSYFQDMHPAHQSDYVRVKVLRENGGIWLDADTLILDSFDSLFESIQLHGAFFVKNKNNIMCNAAFGNLPDNPLIQEWEEKLDTILSQKQADISWIEIGNSLLTEVTNSSTWDSIDILKGSENVYPIHWDECINSYWLADYEYHKAIIRVYQPFIILTNTLYKKVEEENLFTIDKKPLHYFIDQSISNLQLKDYDFIEIGTSSFNTEAEQNNTGGVGLSVEPILDYLEQLPDDKTTKVNYAITANRTSDNMLIYYIPEKTIDALGLPRWLKGCNSINEVHHLHIEHNVSHHVQAKHVTLRNIEELLIEFKVHRIRFLKIDTEGHDLVILGGLFDWIKFLPLSFYPQKIMFESNELYNSADIDKIIDRAIEMGYSLLSRGHDTTLELRDTETTIA